MHNAVRLTALICFLAFTPLLSSRGAEAEKHAKFSIEPKQFSLKAGDTGTVRVTVAMKYPWYTYGLVPKVSADGIGPDATQLTVKPSSLVKLRGKVKAPKPKKKFDTGFEMDIEYYEKTVTFEVPFIVSEGAKVGRQVAKANILLQLCDTSKCLPAEDIELPFTIDVLEGLASVTIAEADTAADVMASGDKSVSEGPQIKQAENVVESESTAQIRKIKEEGVLSFLWLAMVSGALALLTPCVFPMVPITVSFFLKRSEKNKGSGLRDSLFYALGIIVTFSALGVILSALLGATGIGDLATNPWVNIVIALVFLVFAMNLFGAFEIQIPPALMNKLNMASGSGSGLGSIMLMGFTFSLTSFTCTVPFVGTSLIAASDGEWFYPVLGMLGFSGVFAFPFFLLALFPTAMSKLPRAGGWMNNIKVVMGFLEIAAAIKFLSNAELVWGWGILPRDIFLSIWVACCFLVSAYILGVFRMHHDAPINGVGTPRILFAMMFVVFGVYLGPGITGRSLGEIDSFLPPPDYAVVIGGQALGPSSSGTGSATQAHSEENWLYSYEEALAESKKTGKAIFVDFTGVTCTNCRRMETRIFPMPAVRERMDKMIKVRLYTDRRKPEDVAVKDKANKEMQLRRFNSIELPLYAIITPDDRILDSQAFTFNEKEFVEFLEKGKPFFKD